MSDRAAVVRLRRDLYEKLRNAADERGVKVSWMLNRAVDDFMDRLLPAEEFSPTRRDP